MAEVNRVSYERLLDEISTLGQDKALRPMSRPVSLATLLSGFAIGQVIADAAIRHNIAAGVIWAVIAAVMLAPLTHRYVRRHRISRRLDAIQKEVS